ncbi:type II secretion system protein [Gemmatimonadota bacterium]
MRNARGGFTLIEVLIVLVVIGILAGLSLPSLTRAIAKADAARVVSDVRTVDLALRSYLEAGGEMPRSGRWGEAPDALNEYLQENMSFEYKDLDYRLTTQRRAGTAQLRVRYPRRSPIGEALKSYRRPGVVTWTTRRTTFVLAR